MREHPQAIKIKQASAISLVFPSFTEMSHFKPRSVDSMASQKRDQSNNLQRHKKAFIFGITNSFSPKAFATWVKFFPIENTTWKNWKEDLKQQLAKQEGGG